MTVPPCRSFYPPPVHRTADFDFFRMHGGRGTSAPAYSSREIRSIARRIAPLLDEGRDVFAYFNNDYGGYALEGALALKDALGPGGGGGRA